MRLGNLALLAMLLMLAIAAAAAEAPDAPSAVACLSDSRPRSADPPGLNNPAIPPADLAEFAPMIRAEIPPRPKKVIDRKYIALTSIATGLTVMDYEMTQRCMGRRTCVESDPLLPHSRLGMYGTNLPLNAGLFWWSYKRKAAGKRLWWLPTAAVIASHAVGVGTNIRFLK